VCVHQVYDADGSNSIERDELHAMFSSMLSAGMPEDSAAHMSDELKELIDEFVNSMYDSIDCDRSGKLEFDEVAEVIEKSARSPTSGRSLGGRWYRQYSL